MTNTMMRKKKNKAGMLVKYKMSPFKKYKTPFKHKFQKDHHVQKVLKNLKILILISLRKTLRVGMNKKKLWNKYLIKIRSRHMNSKKNMSLLTKMRKNYTHKMKNIKNTVMMMKSAYVICKLNEELIEELLF